MIPLEALGAAVMTTLRSSALRFAERYERDPDFIGGPPSAALVPACGFVQFGHVILAFWVVANNIPNMYSLALTTQALSLGFKPFICVIGIIGYIGPSIVGWARYSR